ncbi:MAG: GntP family permease [Candidatus Omnitrophota bacterium]|jgi:GntP family gluconate:H+ symporter|nr:MAG: GntP family permease [Candidatus Omnitrophota bacterium]
MRLGILLLIAVILIVVTTTRWKLHPFLALLFTAIGYGLFAGMPMADVVKSVNEGFGGTIGYIGIVIIAGTIIGVFLEKSGGAYAMAQAVLRVTGRRNVPLAMSIIGYFVSIPVFCDSGFVILSPLNKALAKKAGISLAACAVALSLGLYATHTMVPPTPGPIAAAGILKADLGQVILYGLIVSVLAMIVGWLYAIFIASRVYIDPQPNLSEDDLNRKLSEAPSAAMSFLPILLPIVLIVLNSIASYPTNPFGTGQTKTILNFVGNPVIALLIGVLISFLLPKKLDREMVSASGWVGEGLLNAAIIIMITGAGGAFGKVLQNSGIADALGKPLAELNIGIWLPFLIAVVIKTAQGSSTVAIITTATLMSSLMEPLGFTSSAQIALVVVMIGAGAMVISHANDSYFWVVTQFSRMDVLTGYKLYSLGGILEGVAAGIVVWVIFSFI